MRKLRIKINPDNPTNVRIDGHAYRVKPSPNLCFGCAFSTLDTSVCPAWDLTCNKESRGLLCTSFVDDTLTPITVIFQSATESDIPRVFIDKPVWEKELREVHYVDFDAEGFEK